MTRRHHRDVSRLHDRSLGLLFLHGPVEGFPVVVIAQGEMKAYPRFTQGRDDIGKMSVIPDLTILKGKIAVYNRGHGFLVQIGQLLHHLPEMHGDGGTGRMLFSDMGVIQQVYQLPPRLFVRSIGLAGDEASSQRTKELTTILKGQMDWHLSIVNLNHRWRITRKIIFPFWLSLALGD